MDKPVKETPVSFTRRTPLVEHVCPVCGNTFQGSKLAVYCSTVCQKKAAWQRNGAKYVALRKAKKGEAKQ
jgi:hypothetical protein